MNFLEIITKGQVHMNEGPYKLPMGWRWVRLGEVCLINPRRPSLELKPSTPTTFVPMAAVDDKLGQIVSPEVKPFVQVKKGYTYFIDGDVLFAKITPCMENGKSAIARKLVNGFGFGSTEFHIFRPSSALISEWIWFFVRRAEFRKAARNEFRGGVGQQRVPAEFLGETFVPLPPLEEQRRIVSRIEELMERVREARRLRQNALEDTDRLWQSVLSETFPRPGTELPAGWHWVQLGEVAEVIMGQSPPSQTYNRDGEGLPFFQGKADFAGLYPSPRVWCAKPIKTAEKDDVLLSVRAPVGSTNIASDRCCIGRGLAAVRPRNAIKNFWLLYYLRSIEKILATMGAGSTFNAVTKKQVISIQIPLPPLDVQQRLVAYFQSIRENITSLKEVQVETDDLVNLLEQSILDRAFRGDL